MGKTSKPGKPKRAELERLTRAVQAGAAVGNAALAAADAALARSAAARRAAAEKAYRKALLQYDRDLARWRSASRWARLRGQDVPRQPVPPPPPLPWLPRGVPGAEAVGRLEKAERHLVEIAPSVEALHPGAGDELRRASAEAAPILHQQALRLEVLARVRGEMTGTAAADAAAVSARDVGARLERGVAAYEGLLTAAATLLGAPDDNDAERVLVVAVEGLLSYTAGLEAVARVEHRT